MMFSVIIPTLNEETGIGNCIRKIRSIERGAEIIVADGGSFDKTVEAAIAEKAIVCASGKGRGTQLNAGSGIASGNILIFLHSDTELTIKAFEELRHVINKNNFKIGIFNLEFDVSHRLLGFYQRVTRTNMPYLFGDRCIVVKRTFFDEIGGFPDLPLFEDLSLVIKARKSSPIYKFKSNVITSSRRYLNCGIVRQQLLDIWFTLLFLTGVPADRLSIEYEKTGTPEDFTALGVFIRLPRQGKVKTRLAASIGTKLATDFYKFCAEIILKEISKNSGHIRRYIFFADKNDRREVRKWLGAGYYYVVQVGGNLGEKLENALQTMLSHGARKALIVGSDIPDITDDIILKAERLLDDNDLVLGPSQDGGYYLIGLKKSWPELFHRISWSTDRVLEQTLARASDLRLKVALLPKLIDIDTVDDLQMWSAATNDTNRQKRLLDLIADKL
jgi:rSAM/selenodomain-associated transferase 2/rSAM/selenodomain-associated transferase 1